MEKKWRFPASTGGEIKGISSGDSETFRKSPFKAFAREILQNSIDARESDEEPVKVTFDVFEIDTLNIPGYKDLKDQVRRCKEFWNHKPDYVKKYDEILEELNKKKITCLRVSDYNTTGLIGVETDDKRNNHFLALAKGTGVSEKPGVLAGGSKGVGKNAAFLMSSINTVFYSTKTNKDIDGNYVSNVGAIGVSELVSGYVKDDFESENRDYTCGTGYFAADAQNSAILELLNLDNKNPRTNETGTDIFIIGFDSTDDWKKEVINSLLDSFMSTIVRGDLEISIDGLKINRNTIKDIVYNQSIVYPAYRSNIVSQYLLLNGGPKVKVYDIDTEYGNCELYILPFEKNEEDLATHKCVMIRHPLMKIKEESLGQSFRVSAMCIIGEGRLGEELRNIENPQHIDWEPKRIKDPNVRKEIENTLKSIKTQIQQRVIDCLQLGDDKPIDPNGAGDYLPDANIGDSGKNDSDGNKKQKESVTISKPKQNETRETKTTIENDNGNALQPDIGEINPEEDGNVSVPEGTNNGDGGDVRPGSNTSGENPGDNTILKKYKLSGVRYNIISTNKEEGRFKVTFIAPIDNDGCYLAIYLLDDMNSASEIQITEMYCNGLKILSDDLIEYGPFSIRTNKKITLEIKTNSKGFFGSGVKVICK